MIEKNEAHMECTLSDTDLFSPAFVQTDVTEGGHEEVYPVTKLEDSGPIEFFLENASEKFLDLKLSRVMEVISQKIQQTSPFQTIY